MTRAPYRSPLRDAAAARTHATILEAGLAAFGERGYEATTVGEIAARAGVSVPTVYSSVGGKRELLLELCREAVASPARGQRLDQLGVATDPERALRLVVAGAREIVERYSPILKVASHARSIPEAFALWEQGLASTRDVCAATAAHLVQLNGLPAGMDVARATTTLSALIHPTTLHTLVDELGLTWDQAEAWLADSCVQLVLR